MSCMVSSCRAVMAWAVRRVKWIPDASRRVKTRPAIARPSKLLNVSFRDLRSSFMLLPGEKVVLVLQGGGALGAYQAGAYQALSEAGIEPDWIAGISIGAINGAIIAGNQPENRVDRL